MIDLNKIEAAAKAATPGPWRYWSCRVDSLSGMNNYVQFANPVRQVFRAPLRHLSEEDATHIATANPATVLEMVRMIRERDIVLRQALEALESQKAYIEANEPGLATTVPVIAAIRDVLK